MLNIINKVLLAFGNPKSSLVIGVVIGLIIGLVIGWGIWPVSYTLLAPVDLAPSFQENYLDGLAQRYAANPQAVDLNATLGDRWTAAEAAKVVDKMIQKSDWAQDKPQLDNLSRALKAIQPKPTQRTGLSSLISWPVCIIGLVLLVVLVGGGLLILRRLSTGGIPPREPGVITPVDRARASVTVAPTEWVGMAEKPTSQFVTTYAIGDDRYDMSFSIESGADFLGECGVAISEAIGVGNPDKVTALEVWLFDKNDIRTVTKVLMSEHCFNDPTLRAKLAPKGEAVLIAPDGSAELDTQTLKLRARVVEMEYGTGGLPPNSFFNKVTLELAAWPKVAA